MRKLRTCDSAHLNTGVSKCPPNFGKKKMAIIVPYGTKLPADLDADKLEELAHAALASRIYGVGIFTEYAKNGGEAQTSTDGYGPEEVTGYSPLKETYNLAYAPEVHAAFVRAKGSKWGVYFIDEEGMLYGEYDGTDTLAPFPMANIYTDVTPSPTSSAKASMTITFSYEDTEAAYKNYDYTKLGFNVRNLVLGLVAVSLEKVDTSSDKYKVVEKVGGYDATEIYGPLLATAGATVLEGATAAAAYDEADKTLTITGSATARLKDPATLFEKGIKGIEQV
mgnify:CR=1 FL=1